LNSKDVNEITVRQGFTPLSELSSALYQQVGQLRVLLAEDNPINQEIVIELLADCGGEVFVVDNGQAAIDLLEQKSKQQETIDVVLMDIQMPIMGGVEAARQIRSQDKWNKIPIIALTASATTNSREEGLAIGMNEYLTKPIIPEELFGALSRLCRTKQGVRQDDLLVGAMQASSGEVVSIDDPNDLKDIPDFKGLDINSGLNTCNGKHALFEKVIRKFSTKYKNIDQELFEALKISDIKHAKALTHNLIGVSANIGALELSQTAKEIDDILSNNDVEVEGLVLQLFSHQLEQVIESITLYCEEDH